VDVLIHTNKEIVKKRLLIVSWLDQLTKYFVCVSIISGQAGLLKAFIGVGYGAMSNIHCCYTQHMLPVKITYFRSTSGDAMHDIKHVIDLDLHV